MRSGRPRAMVTATAAGRTTLGWGRRARSQPWEEVSTIRWIRREPMGPRARRRRRSGTSCSRCRRMGPRCSSVAFLVTSPRRTSVSCASHWGKSMR
uniref:Uncharacterized protein n=1 Tax=Arundo donax TaxID=35708 RepID=A0A0A9EY59_ARUDO